MSSGVPTTAEALEAIWNAIKPKHSNCFEQDASLEASRVLPIVSSCTRGILDEPTSDSAEHIDLPRDSDLTGSSGKH